MYPKKYIKQALIAEWLITISSQVIITMIIIAAACHCIIPVDRRHPRPFLNGLWHTHNGT